MNKQYSSDQVNAINQAISEAKKSQQQGDPTTNGTEWTALQILQIVQYFIMNPDLTQVSCIRNIKETMFQSRSESSIKQLIKRFNKDYQASDIVDIAHEVIQSSNMSCSKMLTIIAEKKYNFKMEQLCRNIIDPPDKEVQKLQLQIINQLNQKYGCTRFDFPLKVILTEYPEIRQSIEQIVKQVQQISQQSEEAALNRFVACNLNMELVKRSIENDSIMWTKEEDDQLNQSIKERDTLSIQIFEKFKGVENVAQRKEHLEKLRKISSIRA